MAAEKKRKPRLAVEPPRIHEATLAPGPSGAVIKGAEIDLATAVARRREGKDIVVCGHSHCGAVRSLFRPPREDAPHIAKWLELVRPAMVGSELTEDSLRRTEMRSIVLQIERRMTFPTVRERVERGELCLHGWYYVIEEGSVLGLDIGTGDFRALS